MNPLDDTIIAISTPPGWGGLGVVRLSGHEALPIALTIFRAREGGPETVRPLSPILGAIVGPETNEALDEAFLTYFAAPRSYTREDVVELSCHGSPVVLEEVLRLGVKAGARAAGPGEFTLRAHLNGRLDAIQAEAVHDLITASNLTQARISSRQLRGGLSSTVAKFRQAIVAAASNLEAAIEFPDEDTGLTLEGVRESLRSAVAAVDSLASTYEFGRSISEGLTLAIVGRANVGKSTLFNALLDRDRAIVSPLAGTTRDYLREKLRIGDAVFQLTDMAGLEAAAHPLEKEGVRRGEAIASGSDGLLFVFDASRPESRTDLGLLRKFKEKKSVLVFNKADQPARIDRSACRQAREGAPSIDISALEGTNLGALRQLIRRTFVPEQALAGEIVLHQRQKLLLAEISERLRTGIGFLGDGHFEDLCAEEVRRSLELVGRLTGEVRSDEVLEGIFSRFCVGK